MQKNRSGGKKPNSILSRKIMLGLLTKIFQEGCFFVGWEIPNNFLKGSFSLDF